MPCCPAASCFASRSRFPLLSCDTTTSAPHTSSATATRSNACTVHTTASTTSVVFRPTLAAAFPLCPYLSSAFARLSQSLFIVDRNCSTVSASCFRSPASAFATAGRRRSSAYRATSRNTWCGCAIAALRSSPCFFTADAKEGRSLAPKCSRSFCDILSSIGRMRSS
eukprot:30294-Pelagococcus_subviridis.AAC.73